jgi:hypothetical protein
VFVASLETLPDFVSGLVPKQVEISAADCGNKAGGGPKTFVLLPDSDRTIAPM